MMSLFSLIGVLGACACVGSSPILSHNVNDVSIVENVKVKPKLVNYDDTSYVITLDVYESKDYVFSNFVNFIKSSYSLIVSNDYNLGYLTYDGAYDGTQCYVNTETGILRQVISHVPPDDGGTYYNYGFNLSFNENDSAMFSLHIYYDDAPNDGNKIILPKLLIHNIDVEVSSPIAIHFGSLALYEGAKNAIQLDIKANIEGFNTGIFQTLTDSVVGFVGSLGTGIVAMTDVFYDSVNQQLTAIGLLSVIVVAVSLTYFLFRLIIGLIRMRG